MTSGPNDHINSYIQTFLGRDASFAVMISGEWGTGKTFLVKSQLNPRSDVLYVSVNGTTKAAEIVERLYLAAFPVFADKTMRALGSIGRTIAGVFRITSDLNMTELLDLDKFGIIIFDDLERSTMKPEELLGFINNFVEHDSKHVILIANDEELSKRENYNMIKEKVVGFTLEVRPDFEQALHVFRRRFPKNYSDFLNTAHQSLLETLSISASKNIRVVNYIVEEYMDVFDQISNAQISEETSILMFLSFFVLDYAYKTGAVSRQDIASRTTEDITRLLTRGRAGYEFTPMDKLDNLHPNVDVFSSSFDNEYLEAKICDGFHDTDKLSRTIGDLSGRQNPSENPEWRNLWYLIHQNDDVIVDSYARMMKKFINRDYDDAGVILHVFGILRRLREAKILEWTPDRITRECNKFIIAKFSNGSLPIMGSDYNVGYRHGSAHGLGFTSITDSGFKENAQLYRLKSDELKDAMFLEEFENLVRSSSFDITLFRAMILQGARDDNSYNEPFLHRTNAPKFAKRIMEEPAKQQFEILSALGSRYDQSPYPDVAKMEAPWLRKLIKELRYISKKGSKATRFRLSEIMKWNLLEASESDREVEDLPT